MNEKKPRKPRSDKGHVVLTDRDIAALTWIGEQYAVRLDQLQWLLGRVPGPGAKQEERISESAVRDVVARWKRGGWIKTEKIRAREPFWVWLTTSGLKKTGLPFRYVDIAAGRLEELKHLYAINEVRNEMEIHEENMARWISERYLAQNVVRQKGKRLPHRPDAELIMRDGVHIAVEVELTAKTTYYLQEEILLELMKGEPYRHARETYTNTARHMVASLQDLGYHAVWYFAPDPVKRFVAEARARLVREGVLSQREAEEIYLYAYPLPGDDNKREQGDAEDEALLDELEGQEDSRNNL